MDNAIKKHRSESKRCGDDLTEGDITTVPAPA